MAQPFLRQIADHFIKYHRSDLYRYRFVFHNRRAGIFLSHYLREAVREEAPTDRPVLLEPEYTTVNSLLRQRLHYVGGEDPNDDLFIIYRIYRAYLGVMGRTAEDYPLEDFYDLGQTILHDFDDIDKQMVDVDDFLEHLREYQDLSIPVQAGYLSKRQWEAISRLIQGEKTEPLRDLDDYPKLLDGEQATEKEEAQETVMEKMKRHFLEFWLHLPELYHTTKAMLRREGLAYEGMMLRDAAEKIERKELDLTDDGMITVFVGLNAQTPAMYGILDHFRDSGRALFYWDYFTDPVITSDQLAGKFYRCNTTHYPSPEEGEADHIDFDTPEQQEDLSALLVSTASSVAQAGVIGELLEGKVLKTEWSSVTDWLRAHKPESLHEGDPLADAIYNPQEPLRTAIVLPDEDFLLPLLGNLPDSVRDINVTMGYPIKGIPTPAMLSTLLSYWVSYYRRGRYYRIREVIDILRFSALSRLFDTEELRDARQRMESSLVENKLYFASNARVTQIVKKSFPDESAARQLLLTIFRPLTVQPHKTEDGIAYPSGKELTGQVSEIISLLISRLEPSAEEGETSDDEDSPIYETARERSILRYLRRSIIGPQLQSQEAFERSHGEGEGADLFTYPIVVDLLRTTIARARIPFVGEPLHGIQVMGILETRGLDFDTVIIPDAAEGLLPTATVADSMIPYSLRLAYHLSSTDLQEQTRAYNFFRLMARAKRVVFLYDSRSSDSSLGEPSRYVQLLRDIYHIPMMEAEASYLLRAPQERPFEPDREKIKAFREALTLPIEDERKRYLSASRMKDFLICPRRFYYTAVEGIRQEENLSELMDRRDSGDLFHLAMKILYEPYKGAELDLDGIGAKQIRRAVEDAVSEMLHEGEQEQRYLPAEHSYNGNQIDIATELVKRTVDWDRQRVQDHGPIHYVGGEISWTTKYEGANFRLIIDRIDIQDSTVHVIDYKTGRSEETLAKIRLGETPDELRGELLTRAQDINGAVLQLLYYCDVLLQTRGTLSEEITSLIDAGTLLHLCPQIFRPAAKDTEDTLLRIQFKRFDSTSVYFGPRPPIVVEDFADDVPDEVIHYIRSAIRLILDKEYAFEIEEGSPRGCEFCPAASLCDKYVPSFD